MRNVYRKLEHEGKLLQDKKDSMRGTDQEGSKEDPKKRKHHEAGSAVGDLDEAGEFGLGVAPREAKPVNKIELSKKREEEIAKMQEESEEEEGRDDLEEAEEDESKLEIIRLKKQQEKKRPMVDKQTAFIEFKGGEGKEIELRIIADR